MLSLLDHSMNEGKKEEHRPHSTGITRVSVDTGEDKQVALFHF